MVIKISPVFDISAPDASKQCMLPVYAMKQAGMVKGIYRYLVLCGHIHPCNTGLNIIGIKHASLLVTHSVCFIFHPEVQVYLRRLISALFFYREIRNIFYVQMSAGDKAIAFKSTWLT